MKAALDERQRKGTLRRLPCEPNETTNTDNSTPPTLPDFSSNDYLGFASNTHNMNGATGSRLLSGDAPHYHVLERKLAEWHGVPHTLLLQSGYAANLSVVSCLAADVIVYDQYIHNSLHMGMRWWQNNAKEQPRRTYMFRHNNVDHLREQLDSIHAANSKSDHEVPVIVILMESVYSMDGDIGPVQSVLDLAASYPHQNVSVVVDEAHGWGVLGRPHGLGALENISTSSSALAFGVFTFGKAAGAHGAVVACPHGISRDYLVNYAYPFIYSTALPYHSLSVIEQAYERLMSPVGQAARQHVEGLIAYFCAGVESLLQTHSSSCLRLLPSSTPIQALIVPGNARCTAFCHCVASSSSGIRLFPIKSPTVPAGQERVRIVLHGHNTRAEVDQLLASLERAVVATTERSKL